MDETTRRLLRRSFTEPGLSTAFAMRVVVASRLGRLAEALPLLCREFGLASRRRPGLVAVQRYLSLAAIQAEPERVFRGSNPLLDAFCATQVSEDTGVTADAVNVRRRRREAQKRGREKRQQRLKRSVSAS